MPRFTTQLCCDLNNLFDVLFTDRKCDVVRRRRVPRSVAVLPLGFACNPTRLKATGGRERVESDRGGKSNYRYGGSDKVAQ